MKTDKSLIPGVSVTVVHSSPGSLIRQLSFEAGEESPFAKVLSSLEQQPQRQDALNDQLQHLRVVAMRLGMYDAADYLGNVLEE